MKSTELEMLTRHHSSSCPEPKNRRTSRAPPRWWSGQHNTCIGAKYFQLNVNVYNTGSLHNKYSRVREIAHHMSVMHTNHTKSRPVQILERHRFACVQTSTVFKVHSSSIHELLSSAIDTHQEESQRNGSQVPTHMSKLGKIRMGNSWEFYSIR